MSFLFLLAAAAPSWSRVESGDRAFSVATPCSAAELKAVTATPSNLVPGIDLPAKVRVLCVQDDVLLLAGTVMMSKSERGESTAFDVMLAASKVEPTAQGKSRQTTVGGRRAYLNREADAEGVAQTGFIEAGADKVIFLSASFEKSSGRSAAEGAGIIDRFTSSVEVLVK